MSNTIVKTGNKENDLFIERLNSKPDYSYAVGRYQDNGGEFITFNFNELLEIKDLIEQIIEIESQEVFK